MLSQKLQNEVDFLKRLGKRFATKKGYLAALKDMLDEGIITKVAYDVVVEYKGQVLENKKSRDILATRPWTPPQESGSCYGGWRSHC